MQLPASPRPASGASSGSPEPAPRRPTRPSQTAPDTRQDAPQATATSHRRDHPRARAHRRRDDRAGRRRLAIIARTIHERRHRRATISVPISPTIPARRYRHPPPTHPGQAHDQPPAGSRQATPPLGHRPRAGDRRRHATIRRVLAVTDPELHAGERRPLANPDQRALVNKRQQRRTDPHAAKLKRHLHAGVEGNAEVARHRSRHMRLPVTRTRPAPTGR